MLIREMEAHIERLNGSTAVFWENGYGMPLWRMIRINAVTAQTWEPARLLPTTGRSSSTENAPPRTEFLGTPVGEPLDYRAVWFRLNSSPLGALRVRGPYSVIYRFYDILRN
ncbi:hypothetical protein J6590_038517 [Homalodisca vitripennis]|nr:hypothetical protein J6590_038517 [Homalodisca vitripennis]